MNTEKIETELKYRISGRSTFTALQNLTHINGFTLEPTGTKTIIDQYLDTANRRVLQAGYACRLRIEKTAHILTLKSLKPASGALHQRQEIECAVPDHAPASWPDTQATQLLQQITGDEPLELLFDLKQTRQKYLVKVDDQAIIELSLDEVWLGEAAQTNYLGLEAELIDNGSQAELARFADQLEAQFPLQPESASKFEQMYIAKFGRMTICLLTDAEQRQLELFAHKAKNKEKKRLKQLKKQVGLKIPTRASIGLLATDSFAEAGRKVLSFHLARMLKHEPGTRLGSDIEELHDMRVATRRMRAAIDLFGPAYGRKTIKPLLAGLKTTGRALGPVRDLDVFIERLEQYQRLLLPEEQAEFEVFLEVWRRRRVKARQEMLKYLDSTTYRKFKKSLHKFSTTRGKGVLPTKDEMSLVPQELRHVVPGLVYLAYDGVRAYETVLDEASIEILHQLRIKFKGLRYTLEFMEEVLGHGKEMVIDEVKMMQDHLGALNDADVAVRIVEEALTTWDKKQRKLTVEQRQSSALMQAYLAEQVKQRERLLATFPAAWTRFNRVEFRQTLAETVSIL